MPTPKTVPPLAAPGAARGTAPTPTPRSYRDRIRRVDLSAIEPPRVPIRAAIDPAVVRAIAGTLRQDGLYQLPAVRPLGRKRFELVWGQTRVCAAREAGWTQIEVLVLDDLDDRQALQLGLNENVQRRDLTLADKLRLIAELQALGYNGQDIARATAISASDVSRLPRIAARPPLWEAIAAGTLTIRGAQELLTLPDEGLTPLLATLAARCADGEDATIVAELRRLAEAAGPATSPATPPRAPRRPVPPLVHLERGLKGLVRADDDGVWDDDTLSTVEELLARLAGEVARQRARR